MSRARKVSILTTSRADYGYLLEPAKALQAAPDFAVSWIVSGSHLAPHTGGTVNEIERDGWTIDDRVEIFPTDEDSPAARGRTLALAVEGYTGALLRQKPDYLMLLGDRYEVLPGAMAAMVADVPVIHLCGGDITEGANDDQVRHALTKLSHLHGVTNADAARRVRQMGEESWRICEIGSPALDALATLPSKGRRELFADLGIADRQHLVLVTYHPVTWDQEASKRGIESLIAALSLLDPEKFSVLVTGTNLDAHHSDIRERFEAYLRAGSGRYFRESVGHKNYLLLMRHAAFVAGNSSSGLYEAPSFRIPTINIGDRQTGRLKASSIIDCPEDAAAIFDAMQRALTLDCSGTVNPYGDGHASERLLNFLRTFDDPRKLLRKKFHDLPIS